MATAVLGTALAYMSDDMLNLAVPSLARDLTATVTDVQWVLNAYYVALISCVLVAGSIGDVVGHRRVFRSGVVLFALGAVGCALAPTVWLLVITRFVQGVGAAMLLASALALLTRSTPAEHRSGAVGQFLGLVAAVPALGPFASGLLVDLLSWRWLFVLPLLMPAAALVLSRAIPETPHDPGRRPDMAGSVLLFLALCGLSVALITGAGDPIQPVALGAALLAGMAGIGFVRAERRHPDPLLPLQLFRSRLFVGGNVVWLAAALISWGAVFFVAVSLQVTLGLQPLLAGLVLTPIYVIMMVGAPLAGRLADRIGPRAPIVGGLLVYALGLLLLSGVDTSWRVVPEVLVAIVVFACGMALFTAPLAAATLGALDEGEQGIASGMNNAMGQLASLLAVAILPAVAGLAGVGFADAAFAAGYQRALQLTVVLALACVGVAAWTFAGLRRGRGSTGAQPGRHERVAAANHPRG